MIESSENLPVITRASRFADELRDTISTAQFGDKIGVSTMQLSPQPGREVSVVTGIVDELLEAHERRVDTRLTVDGAYVARMTRVGNRDIPNSLHKLLSVDQTEFDANFKAASDIRVRLALAGILFARRVKPIERGYTPRLRQIGSMHPFQLFATRHAKAAYIERSNGEMTATITSANFTDSDFTDPSPDALFGMNNLAFQVNDKLARFVMRAIEGGYTSYGDFNRISGVHSYSEGCVTIIHDVNNSGEPGRLPAIHRQVLATLDPRRDETITDPTVERPKAVTHAMILSQYLPDGLLRSTLEHISAGAEVYVPKQPMNDHRVKSFPYNIHSARGGYKIDQSDIHSARRTVPSHVKLEVARYDDGTARILGGTDNFATHLQKFVRNEEIAIIVDLNLKNEPEYEYFVNVIDLLRDMGEISDDVRNDLIA